jgi:signal transduction histidine kinase
VALTGLGASVVGSALTALAVRHPQEERARLLVRASAARMAPLPERERATLAAELTQAVGGAVTLVDDAGRVLPGAPRVPVEALAVRDEGTLASPDGALQRVARAKVPGLEDLWVLALLPLEPATPSVLQLLLRLLITVASTAAVGTAVSVVVARDLGRDLVGITARARRMAQGERTATGPLPRHARDEVGRLVASFNRLQARFEDEAHAHREALARLEENERRQDTQLATLRHELRTPLNAIVGFADLLLSGVDGELTASQREDVQVIATSGGHLLRMVEDVVDLSAMASGRYPLKREIVDMVPIAREVVAEAEGIARVRGVTVTLEGIAEAMVYADRVALRRAFGNLVGNAVEHAGGVVRVSVSEHPSGYAFAVADNGQGIAAADLRRLFKPFERGHTAEARGAGLGLAITLALVELHGGSLSATSAVGEGSTFTATLPTGLAPLEGHPT